MQEDFKRRGRKKKTLDLSLLADADHIMETPEKPFFITCALCGSRKNIAVFKNKHICINCINFVKDRM